jgi:hypothetical protein
MKDEELKKYVEDNATGGSISLPQWASFVLYASQIIRYPIFYSGAIGAAVVMYVLLRNKEDLIHIGIISAIVSLVWLVFIVYKTASEMKDDGVLVAYLSCLASDTPLGCWLVERFGTTTNSQRGKLD